MTPTVCQCMVNYYTPELIQILLINGYFWYNKYMEEHFFKFSLFSRYPELVHGISNRHYGDMRFGQLPPQEVIKNREHFFNDLKVKEKPVVTGQVHGTKIVIVGTEEKGRGWDKKGSAITGTDGLITTEKDVYLMILTADCLPVVIYDPILQIAGVIHAGWRGIIDQIIPETLVKFRNLGTDTENLIAGIGPGICQKHFIVKNSVMQHFINIYPKASFVRNNDGYVDLKKAVFSDLTKLGVVKENIDITSICTVCDNGNYSSVRQEGSGAPEMATVVGIKGKL